MKRVRKYFARTMKGWLRLVVGTGVLVMPFTGWGKEITFVAREAEDQQAVWLPKEIVIRANTDFTEPLIFRFENPTSRTHVFEAPALFESVEEGGVQTSRPVRITIPPEGTELTVIDRDQMASDSIAAEGEPVIYRFYCPLHRADADLGGKIVVRQ